MYTFVANLLAWLERTGRPFTQDLSDPYDVLFVNSWVIAPRVVVGKKRERPDLRVVHRIDGSAEDYGSSPASDRLQARVNLYADATIFQSRYSKFSTREKFRVIAQDGPIIYNPVNVERFNPDGPPIELPVGRPRVACTSWSVNPRKGAASIETLAGRHPDVTFVLCGRFDAVTARPNVVRLGHLTHDQLASALRSCDVFLNLSENESCPNVVLEALASGLPVLFRPSGGVPEIVGDCGRPVEEESFARELADVLSQHDALSAAARRRAETCFAPDRIFPEYWAAIEHSVRRPLPGIWPTLRLAREGFPVIPRIGAARRLIDTVRRRAPAVLSAGAPASDGHRGRIGWVTYDSFPARKRRFRDLDSFTGMRVGNVVRWLEAHDPRFEHELYDPARRYDVVVFQKVMGAHAQAEVDKIHAYGGRVVFDANVNYYEDWGDYFVPGTRPTADQRRSAAEMTAAADLVIADSSYLRSVIEPLNRRVIWIPDNVDPEVYSGQRTHTGGDVLRLVWCGVAKKAAHVLAIAPVLSQLSAAELVLVADEQPAVLTQLAPIIRCRFVPFSDRRYARTLLDSDVIVSPKRLVNAYEMAHTEYKITLGMAVGLPAVAHPQPSYLEAIQHHGGGYICDGAEEWLAALTRLSDPQLRADLGARARATVAERYSTPVVAREYAAALHDLLPRATRASA